MPRMRLRVVWGLGVTMATFSPSSRLSRVDLPTLGRPTIAQNPAREAAIGRFLIMGRARMLSSDFMATVEPRGASRPTSFSKSLFFGLLPEEMALPYPQPGAA